MQVKTRYNRGDNVYLIRDKEIVEGVVACIEVFVKKMTVICYQIKYPWSDAIEEYRRYEHECFATLDELYASPDYEQLLKDLNYGKHKLTQ